MDGTDVTLAPDVYDGLKSIVGSERVADVLNDLAREYVERRALEAGYASAAADKEREAEALEWIEGLIEDVASEPDREH